MKYMVESVGGVGEAGRIQAVGEGTSIVVPGGAVKSVQSTEVNNTLILAKQHSIISKVRHAQAGTREPLKTEKQYRKEIHNKVVRKRGMHRHEISRRLEVT